MVVSQNNGGRSFTQTGSMVNETVPSNMSMSEKGGWFNWIRLVDIYNDGNLDIVVDDANRNLIWINSGSGSFTQLKDIRKIPGFEKKYKSCKKNCADLFLSKEEAARISEEEATKATETDTVKTKESIEKELAAESKATISPTTEEATQTSQSEPSEPIDYIEKLKQIKSLLDAGIINEEDFEKMKQKIIDKM